MNNLKEIYAKIKYTGNEKEDQTIVKVAAQAIAQSHTDDFIKDFNIGETTDYDQIEGEMINDELMRIRATASALNSQVSKMSKKDVQGAMTWTLRALSYVGHVSSNPAVSGELIESTAKALFDLMGSLLGAAVSQGWILEIDVGKLKSLAEIELISPYIPWDEIEKHH